MPASTHLFYDPAKPLLRLAWHEPLPGASVPEAVVQEIWRAQRLRHGHLRTTGGLPVQVLDSGMLNRDGGPDFSNARVRIGEMVWFGDVEIHTTSRGWVDHGHHHDARYNRVVLHVVLQPDLWTGGLSRADGTPLPELVLAPHLDAPFRERLVTFFAQPDASRPCSWGLASVPEPITRAWLQRCALQRLQRRARLYADPDDAVQQLYEHTAAALGYRPNAEAMRRLARRVALGDLCTLRSSRDREALLLGMAGLLPGEADAASIADGDTRAYVDDLRLRFHALQPRDALPLDATEWQYARLRPANFPELRIAQLAALVCPGGPIHPAGLAAFRDMLLEGASLRDFEALLEAAPDDFWTTHYRLTRPAAVHPAHPGLETRRRLLVNVILPAAFAHVPLAATERALDRVCSLYDALPAEDDRLVRSFALSTEKPLTLLHTQGLHELDESFCQPQHCLQCALGEQLLRERDLAPPQSSCAPCSSASSTWNSSPNT